MTGAQGGMSREQGVQQTPAVQQSSPGTSRSQRRRVSFGALSSGPEVVTISLALGPSARSKRQHISPEGASLQPPSRIGPGTEHGYRSDAAAGWGGNEQGLQQRAQWMQQYQQDQAHQSFSAQQQQQQDVSMDQCPYLGQGPEHSQPAGVISSSMQPLGVLAAKPLGLYTTAAVRAVFDPTSLKLDTGLLGSWSAAMQASNKQQCFCMASSANSTWSLENVSFGGSSSSSDLAAASLYRVKAWDVSGAVVDARDICHAGMSPEQLPKSAANLLALRSEGGLQDWSIP